MGTITITSIERIKPSSSTPPHLNSFKLSFLDQLAETVYTPLLFFYSNFNSNANRLEKSCILKESLSAFLTRYYPLAGRLNRNIFVDCYDEGVYYSEADADFPIHEILKEPATESMKRLMPPEPVLGYAYDPLFLVQVTFFTCGGLSIGVCISHKLCDGAAIATVITGWAESARGSHHRGDCVAPLLSLSSIFPPMDVLSKGQHETSGKVDKQRVVARRYVFDASSVAKLKATAASEEVTYPSRVEAVSALIWKCTMKVLRSRKSGSSDKPHGVIWPVNLRARLKPKLSPNSFGNVIIPMVGKESKDESEIKLCKLVGIMRRSIVEINEKYKGGEVMTDELADLIFNSYNKVKEMGDMEFQAHSSWCRFPLYEADFGWGEPVWVTLPYMIKPDIVVLIDSKEMGGVEVWVSLNEEDMLVFDQDQNLLEFASLNPPVHYNC